MRLIILLFLLKHNIKQFYFHQTFLLTFKISSNMYLAFISCFTYCKHSLLHYNVYYMISISYSYSSHRSLIIRRPFYKQYTYLKFQRNSINFCSASRLFSKLFFAKNFPRFFSCLIFINSRQEKLS